MKTLSREVGGIQFLGFAGQEGAWPPYAKEDLIPRLHGFELMVAPYTVAHLKLGLTLSETGVTDFGTRLGVYLTNTLEEGFDEPQDLFEHVGLEAAVADEAVQAGSIKNERPIMVVIGNPPYSGESSNKTKFAADLVDKYKFEPGGQTRLMERNSKWLNDDYVKFIAFAEEMIQRNGSGVVAMITNHSYLDNPTFRGMRWRLLRTFDEIRILDLHGSTKRRERADDGGKDENVFNIQQGVAIFIGIRKPHSESRNRLASLKVAHLRGRRNDKFKLLNEDAIEWNEVIPEKDAYAFEDRANPMSAEYQRGVSIADLMKVHSVGVVTGSDKLLVGWTTSELLASLESTNFATIKGKVAERLTNRVIDSSRVARVAYRPFDYRWLYYDPAVIERSRERTMKHMLHLENVAIMTCRQQKIDGFSHVLAHRGVAESSFVSNRTSEIGYSFPLYLYDELGNRSDNVNPSSLRRLTKPLSFNPPFVDVFGYVYASLHSPVYRASFGEMLKRDFPRIPLPTDDAQFRHLSDIGRQLLALHTFDAADSLTIATTYPVVGSNLVSTIERRGSEVWINETQFFGNVPDAAWSFVIGGYAPVQKWIKDRLNRKLSSDELAVYQQLVAMLLATHRLMPAIDKPQRDSSSEH